MADSSLQLERIEVNYVFERLKVRLEELRIPVHDYLQTLKKKIERQLRNNQDQDEAESESDSEEEEDGQEIDEPQEEDDENASSNLRRLRIFFDKVTFLVVDMSPGNLFINQNCLDVIPNGQNIGLEIQFSRLNQALVRRVKTSNHVFCLQNILLHKMALLGNELEWTYKKLGKHAFNGLQKSTRAHIYMGKGLTRMTAIVEKMGNAVLFIKKVFPIATLGKLTDHEFYQMLLPNLEKMVAAPRIDDPVVRYLLGIQ
jgi:hypothetical protein